MADGYSIRADDYREFYQRTKAASGKIRTRTRKRLRDSAKRHSEGIVSEGAAKLPHRGGLDDHVATKGRNPTVALTATGARLVLGKRKGPQIGRMNEGDLRHPLFGRKRSAAGKSLWIPQEIAAGAWNEPIEKRLPDIRDDVARELDAVLKELQP